MPLSRLLGDWAFTMHHSQMTEPVTGRNHYEPVLDGAFVMLRWSYDHPDFPDAIAMIDEHRYHYFDVRGVVRLFDFAIDDAGWTMTHLDGDFSQRTVARFRGDGAIDCEGEVSADLGASWRHDFTMTLTRTA